MRVPDPWTMILLTFAAYRTVRFLGWDDWPPIYKARAWLIGERWVGGPLVVRMSTDEMKEVRVIEASEIPADDPRVMSREEMREALKFEDPELPGKQPPSEAVGLRPAYDRPLFAHFIHCPFCLSAWTCLVGFVFWELFPHAVTWMSVPVAASGAVGLIAKNWDA